MFFIKKSEVLIVLLFIFGISGFVRGQGVDFYWINGAGNWSDTLHWSSPSGGLPDSTDNVFFDKDSFTGINNKVVIDIDARCNIIDWSKVTGFPILSGDSSLYIYGAMIFSSDMTINFSGDIIFKSGGYEESIKTGNNHLYSDLYFQGAGGWVISDSLKIAENDIYFEKGSIVSDGSFIECNSFIAGGDDDKTFYTGSSLIYINGDWDAGQNLQLINNQSTIIFRNISENYIAGFNGGGLDYHNVIFSNNANINGSNSFENLYLTAKKTYRFESAKTQTFYGELKARGCSGLINIKASGSGKAIFKKSNGDINISYIKLNSIKAESEAGYQLNAYRSIDAGNNSGCNFIADSRDMHWVNGTGNWSDTTHWNSSPAGIDADCVPVIYDNLLFDNNSFDGPDTVNVDIDELMCNNMVWTTNGNVIFKADEAGISSFIYGSLQFSDGVSNELSGDVFFRDTLGGKQIMMAGNSLHGNVFFTGNNGEWELLDSLGIDGDLTFLSGSLKTNGYPLSCNVFHSDSIRQRVLNIENSEVLINGTSPYPSWSLNDSSLTINATGSTITFAKNGSTMYNFGGDTVKYHNIKFNGTLSSARLDTEDDTYCKFGRVVFGSNAIIYGNNRFDTLSLSPGCFYNLPTGKTQTVNYDIWPSGTCEGPVLLESSVNGSQANISTPDTLRVEYTSIRDINATGDGYYFAEHSVDIGNNSGWDTIMADPPRTLYWVGDGGNWSDPAHWSLLSGDAGGECIPTPVDTVVFDINSFSGTGQVVTVDHNNAFAHNFIWDGVANTPGFAGNYTGDYLRIYGSMELSPDMLFSFPGFIWFESRTPGQTVLTNGVKFHNVNNDVHFDGIGGEWTLLDSLNLGKSVANKNILYFYNGTLNTNSRYLEAYSFYSPVSTARTLNLDTSSIVLNDRWYVYGTDFQINENQSVIQIDSGDFMHYYGDIAHYHNIKLNSGTKYQKVTTKSADSVLFNSVEFKNDGEMSGTGSVVIAGKVNFDKEGKINTTYSTSVNKYSIDSLMFNSNGWVYGNDTVGFAWFDSVAYIQGNSLFDNALLLNDGSVHGNNIFDTLTFSPGYTYQFEGGSTQTIGNEFNITGNNCQSIRFQSTSTDKATVHKDTAFVNGDFIEMQNIATSGGAVFDAGYFSTDINSSNEGWTFHDFPKYSLGNDTTFLEGESVYICAKNFNGGPGTLYEWKDCNTGQVISQDSCINITDGGEYCLNVYYDDGPGCVKSDTIKIGCFIALDLVATDVTCNGFANGTITTDIATGTSPFTVIWYKDNQFYDTTLNISSLSPGTYSVSIADGKGCTNVDTTVITQPDSLLYEAVVKDACFGEENGMISLNITGGTEPYFANWSDGQSDTVAVNLAAGQYQVVVTDTNNCPSPAGNFTVGQLPEITFDLAGSDLLCYGDNSGSAGVVNLAGGTGVYDDFDWYLNGQLYDTAQYLSQAESGKYILKITDDYGCHSYDSVIISQPDSLVLHLEAEPGTVELGAINLEVEGGTAPYSYLWTNGATTQNIDPLGGGFYHVWVTDDNGCKSTDSIFVEVHYRILAPTAFSPNSDGTNDYFRVRGLGTDLVSFQMLIYNRWGEVVFKTDDAHDYWNGKKFNAGNEMPEDTYLWQASLEYTSGVKITDKGNVTLLR